MIRFYLRFPLFILSLIASLQVSAQNIDWMEVPFVQNGQELSLANAGGFNAPQFSSIDLNQDGLTDIIAFDRIGNVFVPLLNIGTAGTPSYRFAPEFLPQFPKLNDFALFRDYNGDGAMDIFCENTIPGIFGIEVYKGRYENGKIAFSKVLFPTEPRDLIYVPASSLKVQLYASSQDVPAIDDIDGDGDLDILSFGVGGGVVEYFRNLSVDQGYGLDTLIYIRADDCWGKFFESGLTNCLSLSSNSMECATGVRGGGIASTRHAGSTILTYDSDDDGDKEILLGDISFNTLVLGINGGNKDQSYITSSDCKFPSSNVPTDVPVFPASFLLDIDQDGKRDLLAAPNANNALDFNNVWYYRNEGTEAIPDFKLQQEDLFVGEMVDLGSGSSPVFVDYNADGLMDLIVGNESYFLGFGDRRVVLQLYLNRGTPTRPSFELVDEDWLGFSNLVAISNYSLSPAFGDLDNDGDLDLLVGEGAGRLFYAENTAGPGKQLNFPNVTYNYMSIRIGQNSTPEIADVNQDGKPDLIIGEANGNLNLYRNIGTLTNPIFDPESSNTQDNNTFFGKIDVREGFDTNGETAPRVLEINNEVQLFVGSKVGKIRRYGNIIGNLDGTFSQPADSTGDLFIGDNVRPAFADIDKDGFFEMVAGNKRGGLSFFRTDLQSGTVSTNNLFPILPINVYPNPVRDQLTIELPQIRQSAYEASIYNSLGQLVRTFQINESRQSLNVSDLAVGMYVLEVKNEKTRGLAKFIVD